MSRSRWIVVVLSFAAMITVSVVIVWNALRKHGPPPIVPTWAHAVAFAFVLLEIGSRTVKIQLGAAALSIRLPFFDALRTCLGGDFASCLTPARSGAEPARFLVLAATGMPTANIILVLFVELLMELASLLVVAIGLWLIFQGSTTVLGFLTTIVAGYTSFVLGVGLAGLLLAQHNAKGPIPRWARVFGLHAGHWRRIQRAVRQLRGSVMAMRGAKAPYLVGAFTMSLIHILSRLAILPVIVWSVQHVAELSSLVLWPLVLLYGGAVAPAPGGGGAVEFGFQKAFEGTIPPALLAASLLWWRFYTFYLYILLGALAGGATVFRAIRSEKPAEAGERA